RLSTFARKRDDPLHAHILSLILCDRISDMADWALRGFANNICFIIRRDLHEQVVDRIVGKDCLCLQYQWDFVEKRHRTRVTIMNARNVVGGGANSDGWIIDGDWVVDQREALESLRRTVEHVVYG
ncbi:hypothetical protein EJ02DRAFT_319789, partial [Clathrospora elynae]